MNFNVDLFKTGIIIVCFVCASLLLILTVVIAASCINTPTSEEMNTTNALTAFVIMASIFFVLLINIIE